MTPAERAADRIAKNKVIEANAKAELEYKASKKALKAAINSRKALKSLIIHLAKEDPRGAAEVARRIAPLVTFRTVRGIL